MYPSIDYKMNQNINELKTSIRNHLRQSESELVNFASELIRIPSENPPGNFSGNCATLIAAHLTKLGLTVETVDPSGAGPCVFGTYGSGDPVLYFSGHYDVVPAQDKSQFDPLIQKSNLHGRGSADMKGGIAAMAYAIDALSKSGFVPKGRIVLVSVPDEETSGPRGTVALMKAGLIQKNSIGMLTMEPTSGVVWNANRGVISLRITVRGKPAHVGLHFRGVNAFEGMLNITQQLSVLRNEISQRLTSHNIKPAPARQSILLMGGELEGGHNFNVVPDHVSFTVDRRTNPEEDFDEERNRLLDIVTRAKQQGIDCDVEIFQEGRSAATDAHGKLGNTLSESIQQVTGETAQFELCPGVLETRHYATVGIPAMSYGPGLLSVAHGPNEFVAIPKLLQCAEVYALTAASMLS